MIFLYDELHIISKPRNVKNMRVFDFLIIEQKHVYTLKMFDIENWVFDISWRCLKPLKLKTECLQISKYLGFKMI